MVPMATYSSAFMLGAHHAHRIHRERTNQTPIHGPTPQTIRLDDSDPGEINSLYAFDMWHMAPGESVGSDEAAYIGLALQESGKISTCSGRLC